MRPVAVHLRYDERDALLKSKRGRLVDAEGAAGRGEWDEFSTGSRSDGEEAQLQIPDAERFGSRFLDGQAVECRAGGARGRERAHGVIAPLPQQVERDGSDSAGRSDDPDTQVATHGSPSPGERQPSLQCTAGLGQA